MTSQSSAPKIYDPTPRCAITGPRLQSLISTLTPVDAEQHAHLLELSRPLAELNTPLRVAHFIAQIAHETLAFTRLVESFNYTSPLRLDAIFGAVNGLADAKNLIKAGPEAIANRVYANRMANGPEGSGDGWKFRGRGYLQITGRYMYAKMAPRVSVDLIASPDLAARRDIAAKTAALYWADNKINGWADMDDVHMVTRKINPAMAGLDDRVRWLGRACEIWS